MDKEADKQRNIENYKRYAEIRDKRGLTDYRVSKMIETGNAMFTHWNQGKYTPKPDKLKKIAEVLNVSLSYLIGETDNELPIADDPMFKAIDRKANLNDDFAVIYRQQALLKSINPSKEEFDIILAFRNADYRTQRSVLMALGLDKQEEELRAAHERTDIETTKEMKQHDYDLMKKENF